MRRHDLHPGELEELCPQCCKPLTAPGVPGCTCAGIIILEEPTPLSDGRAVDVVPAAPPNARIVTRATGAAQLDELELPPEALDAATVDPAQLAPALPAINLPETVTESPSLQQPGEPPAAKEETAHANQDQGRVPATHGRVATWPPAATPAPRRSAPRPTPRPAARLLLAAAVTIALAGTLLYNTATSQGRHAAPAIAPPARTMAPRPTAPAPAPPPPTHRPPTKPTHPRPTAGQPTGTTHTAQATPPTSHRPGSDATPAPPKRETHDAPTTPPRLLTPITYPEAARRRLPPDTTITARLTIDPDGRATVTAWESNHCVTPFVKARLTQAITRARWAPARDADGKPRTGTIAVTFKLERTRR